MSFPISFSEIYNNISSHYYYHCPFININCSLPVYNTDSFSSKILFVIGTSNNHFFGAVNCILSILRFYQSSSILLFDYGINISNYDFFDNTGQYIRQFYKLSNSKADLYYKKFNYVVMPKWMELIEGERYFRGGYAWKTISIIDIFHTWREMIVWEDAGNFHLHKNEIDKAIFFGRKEGFYSPIQDINIRKKMANDTYTFMKEYGFLNNIVHDGLSCAAGYMVFDYHNSIIRNILVSLLKKCTFTKRCIQPNGYTVYRHLPEQSVIGIIIHSLQLSYSANKKYNIHPQFREEKNALINYISLSKYYNNSELELPRHPLM